MIFKDYYKILGLDTSKATNEEIKLAYREQAKKYHPDINSNNRFSEERFKDINEAYKTLSDMASRRKYDRMWNSRIGKNKKEETSNSSNKSSTIGDFFSMFFGENNLENGKEVQINAYNKESVSIDYVVENNGEYTFKRETVYP